ncbi:MAG: MFS transporter [Candidatus Omnitrophica bacterium]|nr:MFS transporter [Candidatus Omnitrophota bacterium]
MKASVSSRKTLNKDRLVFSSVLLAALGYFVDIYDLILFSIVRIKSLKSLGVSAEDLLPQGVLVLNAQMAGMLLGGIIWGVLGDKKGRLSVLYGSIILYSMANIANGFVQDVPTYALIRFIAGVGLAGELGVGITLVSEVMSKETRGYGTMIVATIGILGAVFAALIGDVFDWRVAYILGGLMGFMLLLLRLSVYESDMFASLKSKQIKRGSLLLIFRSWSSTWKYLCCILIGIPLWFVVGILITFSPELGKALGMKAVPDPGKAVLFAYIGLAVGDFVSGTLSQILRSRKKVSLIFMGLMALSITLYLSNKEASLSVFYANCLALGFSAGYWAIFVTIAAEQFGTNIRSTVATTVPNFVRGSVVLVSYAFSQLKLILGIVNGAFVIAGICLFFACFALSFLKETYAKDLDYAEV